MEVFILNVSLLPIAGVQQAELVKLSGVALALMVFFCVCPILLQPFSLIFFINIF